MEHPLEPGAGGPPSTDPSVWTKSDVRQWLESVHGGDYRDHINLFKKIDGPRLLALSKGDMKDLVGAIDGIIL